MNERFPTAQELLDKKGLSEDSEELKELPDWLRKAYLKDINHCEHSNCKNKNLEIHRIKRNYQDGTYYFTNIKVLCRYHHDLYHSNEMPNVKAY